MTELTCPYTAKVLEDVTQPGSWGGLRMGVFHGEELIGEYSRTYHSFGVETFCPFMQGGRWFALYSKNYTCTRLMSLPDCQDIGGEEPDGFGFCPVELYVPVLCTQDVTTPKPYNPRHDSKRWATTESVAGGTRYHWRDKDPEFKRLCKEHDEQFDAWMKANPFTHKYAPFGFVAGCIWGDDSSWKVQYIDLTDAASGIIRRDDRFGYLELPSGVSLRDAIDTSSLDYDFPYLTIATRKTFKLSGTTAEAVA